MISRHFKTVFFCVFLCVATATAQDSIPHPDSTLLKANLAKASLHLNNASQLFKKNKPQDAFTQLNIAQAIYKKAGDPTGQALTWQSYGDYYAANYVWKKAESSYLQSLKLIRKDENELRGNISAKLADIYLRWNNLDNAAKYFNLAINEYDKADLIAKSASNYVRLANIKRMQKRYSDAEFIVLRRALPLFRSAGFTPGRISCFDALGHMYHDQKRYSEAKWYYIQANMQGRNLGDTVAITESLINLGNVKTSIGDYKLALKDFKEAGWLAKRHKLLKQQRDLSTAYARLYAKTGNKYASDSSLRKVDKLNDSMHNLEQEKISIASNVKPTALPQKKPKALPAAIAKIALLKEQPWLLITIPVVIIFLIVFFRVTGRKSRRKNN